MKITQPEGRKDENGYPCGEKVSVGTGTTGGWGLPMDPRATANPGGAQIEGPQGRSQGDPLRCDNRAVGRSLDKFASGQKRGAPHGGESMVRDHSVRPKSMPKYAP